MKKIPFTGADIVAIVVFVVLTLAGVAGWYFLSANLQDAQTQATAANDAFQRNATNAKYKVVVSHSNMKTLQSNIDVVQSELNPLVTGVLHNDADKLPSIAREDPVAWKHDLDDQVRNLSTAAKVKGVTIPANFYFGFSRYRSQSPGDEQTAVLSKQLLGIEQIATVMIDAPVKTIDAIRRTYEEGGSPALDDPDGLVGRAYAAAGNLYTVYPFEADFTASPETLRPVINKLIESPYILILRSMSVESSSPDSPMTTQLQNMVGAPSGGPDDTTTSVRGPQFLFGNATLKVKIRVDMIEWLASATPPPTPPK